MFGARRLRSPRPILMFILGLSLIVPALSLSAPTVAHATTGVNPACAAPTAPNQAACVLMTSDPATGGSSPAPGAFGPGILRGAYHLQPVTEGMDETVAVVGAGAYSAAASDLSAYRAHYGLPNCTIGDGCLKVVSQTGGGGANLPTNTISDWPETDAMSLDVISAECPNCRLILVEASTDTLPDLSTAAATAAGMSGVVAVDNPYATQEVPGDSAFDAAYDQPGVAMVAPSGDNGSGYTGAVNYPSSSQYVVSVGGTELDKDATTGAWEDVSTWAFTVSGCSSIEPKPTWQTDPACAGRSVNNLSAAAATDGTNGDAPVAYYNSTLSGTGPWQLGGGTNLSAAIVTAAYALQGSPGPTPPADPYDNPGGSYTTPGHAYPSFVGLNDITSGTTCTGLLCTCTDYRCTPGAGYDGPTGLGTPNGTLSLTSSGQAKGNIYESFGRLCLDNASAQVSNNNPIEAFTCSSSVNGQQWIQESSGSFEIGGDCMGLSGGGTTNGTGVILFTCDGADTQQWEPLANNEIVNKASGKCLEDPTGNAGGTSGTQLVLETCTTSDEGEQWGYVTSVTPIAAGEITSHANSGQCIDNSRGQLVADNDVDIFTCNNGVDTQQWALTSTGQLQLASSWCLSWQTRPVGQDPIILEQFAVIVNCVGGSAFQRWLELPDGTLADISGGACLAEQGSANGDELQLINTGAINASPCGDPDAEWTLP